MANLTKDEQLLFAKYWGQELGREFWEDIRQLYFRSDALLPLPAEYNQQTIKQVLDMLDCPPGKCGLCCKYPQIHVTKEDIHKIVTNTEHKNLDVKEDDKGYYYLDVSDGCPFLRDNCCSMWEHRPLICYLYPIQGGRPY